MVVAPMDRLGMLFTLVGPGGVGKNALLNEMIDRIDNLKQLPTATTRQIRPGEEQGREHLFVTLDEFKQMIANNALLEHQEVHPGKFYGVPRSTVENAMHNREDLIADIDILGAAIIQSEYPDSSVTIFVAPPSVSVLSDRLKHRQANTEDTQDRLKRFPKEMLFAPLADYVVVNDDIEEAIGELLSIIHYEQRARSELESETNKVTFSVEVEKNGETLTAPVDKAMPEAVALKLVTADNLENLRFLTSECQFDRVQSTYHVTYKFTYEGETDAA